jgi:UDP-2-acetamido-3-amino-2,3-dideoxy-glucuronate N-acetyltransferase
MTSWTPGERDALTRRIAPDVKLGKDVRVHAFVNLYGCVIGDETAIGTFVEIQKGVTVGARCKIQSHTFICEGVTLEDEVFVGHNVSFLNDRWPAAVNDDGTPKGPADWRLERTLVKRRAAIGSGAVILPGITIGTGAIVGAGAVVTADVADDSIVVGNPAKLLRFVKSRRKDG